MADRAVKFAHETVNGLLAIVTSGRSKEDLALELAEARAVVRDILRSRGDSDWDAEAHLADVIERLR